jgi:anti-sigma B factor antagonist
VHDEFFAPCDRNFLMVALSVHMTHHLTRSVLALEGELDIASAAILQPAVDMVITSGRRHLVLETAGITFSDSYGLWALLQAQRSITAAGGTMELIHVHGALQRVLDLTDLAGAFTITPNDKVEVSADLHITIG